MDIEDYAAKVPQYYSLDVPLMLERHLRGRKPGSVLDCGCGDGSLLYALKKKGLLLNKKVFAVDLSKTRADLVRNIDESFIVKVSSAEDLSAVDDRSVDFLISTQVIEHVNDKKMIAAVGRVVRSGGCVYLSTVFKKWYGWYFYKNNGKWVLDPTHLREYRSDEELLGLIDQNEFSLVEHRKTSLWFPIVDFFVKRLGVRERTIFENRLYSWARKIKAPVLGYFNWEIVLTKN